MTSRTGAARLALWIAAVLGPLSAWGQIAVGQLADLYLEALKTNPAVTAQARAVDRAQARHDQVASRLLPQATASLNAAHNDFRGEGTPSDHYGSHRNSLTVRQALLDRATVHQSQAEELRIQQARQELEAGRMELAAEVVEKVLDVLDAAADLRVLRAEKESVASQRARLRRMAERQLAKVTDLLGAEAYYVTLQAREIETDNTLRVALEKLRQQTGVEVQALPALGDSLPQAEGDMEDWVRRGVQASARLAAARSALEAERSGVYSARAQHAPQLALLATRTWSDSDSDSRRNPAYNVASVGVQLNISLFEGGRVEGAVREALAREAIARAQYDEARREVEVQIRTAWLKLQGGRQRIDAAQLTVQAQEKARDAQQRGFELGAVTVVDVLETQRRLFRARADQQRVRHDYVRSLAALRRHAGMLDAAEMQAIGRLFSGPPPALR